MRATVSLLGVLLALSACNGASDTDDSADTGDSGEACVATLPVEGPPTDPYPTVLEPFDLLAPSGNRIYGQIRRPDPSEAPDLCFPAVVRVPGGLGAGYSLAATTESGALAEAGMVVLSFNAEGRGGEQGDPVSEGTEDHNGHRHQDGLCAVVEYAMDQPAVIADNVGIATHSYGITMGAGCVGRHPELGVKYLVDGEGPSNSFVTAFEPWALDADPANDRHEIAFAMFGHYSRARDPSPENQAFWDEREADTLIGDFEGRYLRLQAEWDHAQPPSNAGQVATFHLPPDWWQNKHATDMVNAAVAGGVPWVRVNLPDQGNGVGATYSDTAMPTFLPGHLADSQVAGIVAVVEMARME